MHHIRLLCLADSRKPGGHCIAGIDLTTGQWVRPVKNEHGGGLSSWDIQYNDGNVPKILDVIQVPVIKHSPLYYQPENWIVAPATKWQKVGENTIPQLKVYWQHDYPIFLDDSDRLTEEECRNSSNLTSLILIKLERLLIDKQVNPWGNRDKIRAKFNYNGNFYDLAVTDILWETKYLQTGISYGIHTINGPIYLTISLGEKFEVDGCHYKLVSGIIK